MITTKEIREKIEKNIPNSSAEVFAVKPDGMHFKAIVQSKKFEGKTMIEQHRMVYDSLKEEFKNGLHSLSIEVRE